MTTWLTRTEAAEHLRVTPSTIDRWARQGLVTRHRLTGTARGVRYKREELDALLQPVSADEDDDQGDLSWATVPPTSDNRKCQGKSAGYCRDCDHVWCRTCERWINDTGFGPSCGHQKAPWAPAA